MENISLICASYKRPLIAERLINSVPENINIIIVNLSPEFKIKSNKKNLHIIQSNQMPLTNALNLGVLKCDEIFIDTKYYILTDDDVIFNEDTIFDEYLENILKIQDTGLVGITRIINKINRKNEIILSPHVYKGGGWIIRKEVFHKIGKFTENNSADEWDICLKSFINGYKNYRTKSCYAYHKQGTNIGGYKIAVKEGSNLGKADLNMLKYIDGYIEKISSGYETIITKKSKFNLLAKKLHNENNKLLWK